MSLIILILSGLLNGMEVQQNDAPVYYAKVTYIRNYQHSDRTAVTEYWYAGEKTCSLRNQEKIITRGDLGLIYTIDMEKKAYRVDTISTDPPASPSGSGIDFKYIGQNYIPVYEWKGARHMEKVTVGKHLCDHFSCNGDADFDRISLDYFLAVSEDNSLAAVINAIMINNIASSNRREPLVAATGKEKNLVLLKMVEKVENPVANPITNTYTVDIFGETAAGESIFEPPADFRKID